MKKRTGVAKSFLAVLNTQCHNFRNLNDLIYPFIRVHW
jgi:hypothetical protein